MPASRHASRSSGSAAAVSATTGTWPCAPGSARMREVASKPSISGICTSISTTAYSLREASSTASRPAGAVSATKPARATRPAATARLMGLSSTTSTRRLRATGSGDDATA